MSMIKPGMFISDRYEIIEKIGSGGMADVYKAKCHRLNRFVAIKILKPEYSSDKNFVTKFRGEAQSCAGLTHPNIVSVFDVGDDGDLHYIVMEIVEGITLKRFIERKGRLDIKEAVGIAIQIAQGLDAAHQNHVIHRDIKPQNIIISKEGKVKVADFGIAKAATSNTINQNAVGSVHYLSPEQARGGYSDERSDIYSLGVTMYEMLSGRVPFAGDNSVSVALLHIQGEATPLSEINPDVSPSLEKIVQKCMQKKPERRYMSANELIQDLKASIMNPSGDFVKMAQGIVTDSPTRQMTAEELAAIKSSPKHQGMFETEDDDDIDGAHKISGKDEFDDDDDLDEVSNSKQKVYMIGSAIIALALVICIIVVIVKEFNIGGSDNGGYVKDPTATNPVTSTPTVVVKTGAMPRLLGYSSAAAREKLESLNLNLNIIINPSETNSDEYAYDQIMEQDIPAGSELTYGDKVTLTSSIGPEEIILEETIIGLTKTQIETVYGDSLILKWAFEDNTTDVAVEENCALRTEPEIGTTVPYGTIVTVFLNNSSGILVPEVVGKTKEEAISAIEAKGFTYSFDEEDFSDKYAAGTVMKQTPEGGRLEAGANIELVISLGKEPVATATPTPEPTMTPEPTLTTAPEPTSTPEPTADASLGGN